MITLQIFSTDLAAISVGLVAKVEQGQGFFLNSQVVLDFTPLDYLVPDIPKLLQLIRSVDMIPIGYSCSSEQLALLGEIGLPLIEMPKDRVTPASDKAEELSWLPPLVHSLPIRSGQQIYAKKRDLVLTSQVSSSSEVLADGNIHIYGALRGRALCGVSGYSDARIYCQRFDAELVSVAGVYKLIDDSFKHLINQAVQIQLVDDRLEIEAMC